MPNGRTVLAMFVRLAWRNLWRNKKRTLIAGGSVFFAVFLAVAMYSMQTGQHDFMIESAVGMTTGHLQIHGKEYWEKRSLDQSMVLDTALLRRVASLPHVAAAVPRLETVALISRGTVTKVCPVIGIDPPSENAMTGIDRRVVRGVRYSAGGEGTLVAEGLARTLGVDVGDSIVIYGQGYQGVTAAQVIRIGGILHFAIPDLNNSLVSLRLPDAQDLLSAPGRITALAILLDSDGALDETADAIRAMADSELEVMTWREMMPELLQAIAADNGATVIMLLILYVVIGFGVFGTVMMMTAERTREFGVSIALGMKRRHMMAVTVIESMIIGMLGACAGIITSVPVTFYFHRFPIRLGGDYAKAMLAYGLEPIIPFSVEPMIFIGQGLVVLAIGAISALYPVLVLRRLEPVGAMRGARR
ncbi:MAG: FtsX-like permease family protein [Bacteroidota bacterium]